MKAITTKKEGVQHSWDTAREAQAECDKLRALFPDTRLAIYRGENSKLGECWYLIQPTPGEIDFVMYMEP